MKKIISILLLSTSLSFSQELTKNLDTGKFEYIEIVNEKTDNESFKSKLSNLGYKDFIETNNSIKSQGFFNEQVMGFVVEIFYDTTIEFKDDKYRIKINNVLVKDNRGTYVLEDMGGYQKKWLKKFNQKLPEIIEKLKKESVKSDW